MAGKNDIISLTKEQKEEAKSKIREYITENFDIEIGGLQAEFFLDYITANFGIFYYNKAVEDSMTFCRDKVEDLYLLIK